MLDSVVPLPHEIKILVVDDNRKNIQQMETFLRREGHQVVSATSGEEAIEKATTEKPSLVLLNVAMPGLDGLEVCRRIKGNPATLFLPVILVTAPEETEHRAKGVEVGADAVLTKPMHERELLGRVKSLVRMKAQHDALETSNRELRAMVGERTRLSDKATQELQKPLEEKAHSGPNPTRACAPRPIETSEPPALQSRSAVTKTSREALRDSKRHLLSRLTDTLEGRADLSRSPEIVGMLNQRLAVIYQAADLQLPDERRQQLFHEIVDEVVGYGPIEPLLADPTVSEVMVNGPNLVYAERSGKLSKIDVEFDDDEQLLRVIDRIVRPLGRRVDRKFPAADARLPDGSRVNVIIPPCAIDGPTITIRKFTEDKLTVEDLISFGSMTLEMAEFLEACVRSRLNVVVTGGTGSGKTTLLNVLSLFIPADERIVTIEDAAELQLHQEHVVRLEYKPPDRDGTGEMSIRSLVRNSLRMRPDRIVVGEVRGGEALDMLQAMNTGHSGSMTTLHANSPRDTVARLETMVLMAGIDLPTKAVRSQIASAIDLIIQTARLQDGSRKVVQITEVQGMEGDVVLMSDIFLFKEQRQEDGQVVGQLQPTGIRPKFTPRLEAAGFALPANIFMAGRGPVQMDFKIRRR